MCLEDPAFMYGGIGFVISTVYDSYSECRSLFHAIHRFTLIRIWGN